MNRKFFADVGLCNNAEEFQIAVSFAGWGTGGSLEHQRVLGLKMRRLLDMGRLLYLRDVLQVDQVKMVPYVSSKISKDNMVLVGRSSSGQELASKAAWESGNVTYI